MIISHKYKYIFIKPKKVAGTSVHQALAETAGPEDIIYPLSDYEGFPRYTRNIDKIKGYLYEHSKPHVIKLVLEDNDLLDCWYNYTKVTIVRNPWDCLISGGANNKVSINHHKHINSKIYEYADRNYEYYFENGKWIDYHFLKFENIEEDYKTFCVLKGIVYKQLPKMKTNYRPLEHKDYRQFYNERTKNIVADRSKELISKFNYKF
jgi:hypothetical protein